MIIIQLHFPGIKESIFMAYISKKNRNISFQFINVKLKAKQQHYQLSKSALRNILITTSNHRMITFLPQFSLPDCLLSTDNAEHCLIVQHSTLLKSRTSDRIFQKIYTTEYSRKFISSPISTLDKYAVDYTSTLPLAVQRPDSSTACYSSALDSS